MLETMLRTEFGQRPDSTPFPTSCPTPRRFTSLPITCRKRRDPKSPLFTLVARVRPPCQTWGVQIPPPRPMTHASPVSTGSRAVVKFLATRGLQVRAIAGQRGTVEDHRGRGRSTTRDPAHLPTFKACRSSSHREAGKVVRGPPRMVRSRRCRAHDASTVG
jgi:hypothetical protein